MRCYDRNLVIAACSARTVIFGARRRRQSHLASSAVSLARHLTTVPMRPAAQALHGESVKSGGRQRATRTPLEFQWTSLNGGSPKRSQARPICGWDKNTLP